MTDWDRIVREHGPMVFGTAWRILGHVADTEDVQAVNDPKHSACSGCETPAAAGYLKNSSNARESLMNAQNSLILPPANLKSSIPS